MTPFHCTFAKTSARIAISVAAAAAVILLEGADEVFNETILIRRTATIGAIVTA